MERKEELLALQKQLDEKRCLIWNKTREIENERLQFAEIELEIQKIVKELLASAIASMCEQIPSGCEYVEQALSDMLWELVREETVRKLMKS